MMSLRHYRAHRSLSPARKAAFTLVELMIGLVISLIVVGALYRLMIVQGRSYTAQRELLDVRGSAKATAVVLTWELRQASARGGDLTNIATNSFSVRSIGASGIVCGRDSSRTAYGLFGTSGQFTSTANDSALMFAASGLGRSDDSWRVVKITSVTTPAGGGVPKCFWGDSILGQGTIVTKTSAGRGVPNLVIGITGSSTGVWIGAPVYAFRQTTYGLYQDTGRWWLGRKLGAATTYEKLTGPLGSPTDSGLVFKYYDATGAVTTDPLKVVQVDIAIRGESYGTASNGFSTPTLKRDTIRTRVALRG